LSYRRRYGSDSGPWTTDKFVDVVYKELAAKKKSARGPSEAVK